MNIDKIVQKLKSDNSPESEFVQLMEELKDPFLVLVFCILSLRTNDKTTIGASRRMLEYGKTAEDYAKLSVEQIEKAIYPVGFYSNKAKQIKEIAQTLCTRDVPKTIDELVKFKGVGRKTANLVLAKGWGIPAICVDVHVHRICNRLGYVRTKTPEETEMRLREILPMKYWLDFNTLLVTHGQNVCKPVKPLCEKCSLTKFCRNYRLSAGK